eukprot:c20916_g1_i1.p1 GENE.c20916_g1_i1~~c20916_g1_i1.p1  ORF type:complete len:257 (+),score=-8.01 c20916_g1_i1:170-940(+)
MGIWEFMIYFITSLTSAPKEYTNIYGLKTVQIVPDKLLEPRSIKAKVFNWAHIIMLHLKLLHIIVVIVFLYWTANWDSTTNKIFSAFLFITPDLMSTLLNMREMSLIIGTIGLYISSPIIILITIAAFPGLLLFLPALIITVLLLFFPLGPFLFCIGKYEESKEPIKNMFAQFYWINLSSMAKLMMYVYMDFFNSMNLLYWFIVARVSLPYLRLDFSIPMVDTEFPYFNLNTYILSHIIQVVLMILHSIILKVKSM